MPRIGITRTKEQLEKLTAAAQKKGIEIVPLPLISIRQLTFAWPLTKNETADWLVFTSGAGVDAFFDGSKRLNQIIDGRTTRVACIGQKTAENLVKYNLEAAFISREAFGDSFFAELSTHLNPNQHLIYARAREINFDPAVLFLGKQINYHPVICYETVSESVERTLVEKFADDDHILFTAPSTVRSFHSQFGIPHAKVIAIGRTTAAEMARLGWPAGECLKKPEIEMVLEQVS